MGTGKFNAGVANPGMDQHLTQPGREEILLVASCYRNQDKHWPDGQLGSYAKLTFIFLFLNDFTKQQSIIWANR